MLGEKLSQEMNMPFRQSAAGEYVAGTYRQRFTLASGRFAMVDDGLGFSLLPWTPSVEKRIGQHVSGVARADGGVDLEFRQKAWAWPVNEMFRSSLDSVHRNHI
jgi:hypothetical protein